MAEKELKVGTMSCTTYTKEIIEELKKQGYEIVPEAELTQKKEQQNPK